MRLVLLLCLVACRSLPVLESGACGNGVLDEGETCDGFADPGLRCGESCRFECGPGAACPTGWACGVDAVCRHAAFQFAEARPILALGEARVSLGDFDDDRRPDVLASQHPGRDGARLMVGFGDGAGGVADVVERELGDQATGFPIAAFLDDDKRDDLLLPVRDGLSAFLGTSERRFEAQLFESRVLETMDDVRLLPWRVFPSEPFHEVLYLVGRCMQLGALPDNGVCQPPAGVPLPDGRLVQELSGEARVAELVPGSRREQLLLAAGDAVHVYAVELVDAGGRECGCPLDFPTCEHGCTPRITPQAVIPAPGLVSRGVQVGDLDGDGDLDLIAWVDGEGESFVARADNDGSGGFTGFVRDGFFELLQPSGPAWPLAVARLDADAVADFVLDDGIHLRRPVGTLRAGGPSEGLPWARAVVADLDDDGAADVVASGLSGGLDHFRNTGVAPFNRTSLATGHPVVALAAGDFDGDGVDDLVVGESTSGQVQLGVWFGHDHALPGPAIDMGRLPAITSLTSFLRRDERDVRANLLVLLAHAAGSASDVRGVVEMPGNVGRRLSAPMVLGFGDEPPARPIAVLGGQFVGSVNGALALTAVGMWYADGFGSGGFLNGQFRVDLPGIAGGFGLDCTSGVSTQLDRDGDADVVLLRHDLACAFDWPKTSTVHILRRDGVGFLSETWELGELGLYGLPELRLADLDADGFEEMLLVFTEAGAAGPSNPGVVVFPGRLGGYDMAGAEWLVLPDLRGFTVANVDAGPDLELVYATDERLGFAHWTREALIVRPESLFLPTTGHLTSGDLNADGLDDVIVAGREQVFVLLAVPSL